MSNLSNEQLENLMQRAGAAYPGPYCVLLNGNRKRTFLVKNDTHVLRKLLSEYELLNYTPAEAGRIRATDTFMAACAPETIISMAQELLQHRAAHATGEAGEAVGMTLKPLMLLAYDAGWAASGEGYNAELIYQGEEGAEWCLKRDAAIRRLLAALTPAPAQTPHPAALTDAERGNYESMQQTNQVLARRLEQAANVLKGYEQWEGSIIDSDAAWNTRSGHPWMTDELYDRMMELQAQRNQVLRPAAALAPAPAPAPQPAASRCGSGGVEAAWVSVADRLPEEGRRVMLVNSKFPSGYPVFAVLRRYKGAAFWKLMPARLNSDFEQYDRWSYTHQPANPHDPAFATPPLPTCTPNDCRTCRAAGDAGDAKEGGVEA